MFYKKSLNDINLDRNQVTMLSMDDLVPNDHLVRKVESAISFNFIYNLVEDLYSSEVGRNSIDPVMLFKIIFINYLFGINSIRKTVQEIKVNVAYRWFLGLSLTDSVPNHSAFSQVYARKFKDKDIFEKIFSKILKQAIDADLVDFSTIFVDGTHIKANANKKKVAYKEVKKVVDKYRVELDTETREVRESMGRDSFNDKDGNNSSNDNNNSTKNNTIEETKIQRVSLTDPDCGIFNKGEHEIQCAYVAQVACDKHGWILGNKVNPGNVHDSKAFLPFYFENLKRFKPEVLVGDAAYINALIAHTMMEEDVLLYAPYKRPIGKRSNLYSKKQFKYIVEIDAYQCPNSELLYLNNVDKDGYKQYVSETHICKNCPLKSKCIGNYRRKTVTRHIYEDNLEYINSLRKTKEWKETYPLRKETIERDFAEGKEKHCLRYTRYRGLSKNQNMIDLLFACMNMKKLANIFFNRKQNLKEQPVL